MTTGNSFPVECPHCDYVADSMDSYGDSRAELDFHMERQHPDTPDPRFDPRWGAPRRVNGYQCDACGGAWLSVDLDDGVTPMFSPCFRTEGCEGVAVSMGYPDGPPPRELQLLIEWYKPTSLQGLDPALVEHVQRGGLLRRAASSAPAWVKALADA